MSTAEIDDVESQDSLSPAEKASPLRQVIHYAYKGALIGFFFGFLLEKANVYVPDTLVDQFRFGDQTMLKVFLAANAVTLLLVRLFPQDQRSCRTVRVPLLQRILPASVAHVLGTVLGTFILGVGMAVSGACPGTVLVQLGAGLESAWWTLLGALLGVLVHMLLTQHLVEVSELCDVQSLSHLLGYNEGESRRKWAGPTTLALVFGVTLLGASGALELIFPFRDDVKERFPHVADPKTTTLDPTSLAWIPMLVGVLLGLLQLPALMSANKMLGASSSYQTVVALAVRAVPSRALHESSSVAPLLKGLKPGAAFQLFLAVFAVLGGALSANLSDEAPVVTELSRARSILGGMLLLIGARMAGGCTSGHGISGAGTQSLSSWLAIMSMFAGAIVTTAIIDAVH
ncbi:MAG: hypothetical protein MHM6MM_003743 [Cercozoa sp. M6MM]